MIEFHTSRWCWYVPPLPEVNKSSISQPQNLLKIYIIQTVPSVTLACNIVIRTYPTLNCSVQAWGLLDFCYSSYVRVASYCKIAHSDCVGRIKTSILYVVYVFPSVLYNRKFLKLLLTKLNAPLERRLVLGDVKCGVSVEQ